MAQETLQQVFGANVTQTATTLTINKADLAAVGLTANAANNPGELFTALLLNAQAGAYNSTNQGTNPEVPITITESTYPSIDVRNSQNYLQQNFTVSFETVLAATTVNPMNYI